MLATLPTSLMGLGGLLQAIWCEASIEETGRARFWDEDVNDPEIQNRVSRLVEGERWSEDHLHLRFTSLLRCVKVEEELEGEETFIDDGLSVFLWAQAIMAWTLFETTAKDFLGRCCGRENKSVGKQDCKAGH